MKIQEFTGKTTQEAIDNGLAELGVTIADVHVDVLQEGAKGLFGLFGSKPAPTIKLASNTPMFTRLEEDMDINCGVVIDGECTVAELGQRIFEQILRHASGEPTDETLYNPATGEGFTGFRQVCGSGTACFETSDGRYELRDLATVDRTLIGTFDDQPSSYFPGYVVTWRTSGDFGYDLHDLVTGEVTPLYASSVMSDTIALYYEDGRLKVFNTETGDLITDTTVEPVEGQQSVMMDNKGDGYVWLELRDNDNFETTATRVYGPEGLVSDLTHLQDKYYALNYLITTPEGRPLYCGNANAPSSNGSMCDVLDENGNIVFYGLGSCYSYYDNSLNQLPEHVFVAKRGFYYGWMDTNGKWLYCQSIFSSINADDEMGY